MSFSVCWVVPVKSQSLPVFFFVTRMFVVPNFPCAYEWDLQFSVAVYSLFTRSYKKFWSSCWTECPLSVLLQNVRTFAAECGEWVAGVANVEVQYMNWITCILGLFRLMCGLVTTLDSRLSMKVPSSQSAGSRTSDKSCNTVIHCSLFLYCDPWAIALVMKQIVYDRESGQSRGFGFVTFTNPRAAAKAINGLDGGVSSSNANGDHWVSLALLHLYNPEGIIVTFAKMWSGN